MRFSGAICTCSHLWAAPQSQWFQAISGCLQCFNACFVESWCLPQEMYFVIVSVWFCLRSFRDLDIRHIWKSVGKVGFSMRHSLTVPASFVRSLGIKFTGRLLAELNLIDRQLSVQTFSKGESQGLWSEKIPLWNLSCTALETRTGIMIWRSLHDSCWLKSEHSFCNRTAAHQNADVFFLLENF